MPTSGLKSEWIGGDEHPVDSGCVIVRSRRSSLFATATGDIASESIVGGISDHVSRRADISPSESGDIGLETATGFR